MNLDADWLYRKPGRWLAQYAVRAVVASEERVIVWVKRLSFDVGVRLHRHHGPQGLLARTWPTGSMVLWVAFLLGIYLIFYYVY